MVSKHQRARQTEPERGSRRLGRGEGLRKEIRRVWEENFRLYGVRKM